MQADSVRKFIAQIISIDPSALSLEQISGGDTHAAFRIAYRDQLLFVKANSREHAAVLHSEYHSLRDLRERAVEAYPAALFFEQNTDGAILAMQFHELSTLDASSAISLGRTLAKQHRQSAEQYGWHRNNYIGLTPQLNTVCDSWATFFCCYRIKPQLEQAAIKGLSSVVVEAISDALPRILEELAGASSQPALLHGDLWSGNAGFSRSEQGPLLFDPAPYYGDAEVDLAMSELFGCFPAEFYRSYYASNPKRAGYQIRKNIYNLYHALNHFNLFGDAYLSMVAEHVERL